MSKALEIEYENEDIIIVDKPAGLPVYSTKKKVEEQSVISILLEKYPLISKVGNPDRPGVVHRLDKQTSGLLVVVKTQKGFEYFSKLFRERQISKEYLALVYGQLPKHGVIDEPLTKIGHRGVSKVRVDKSGKEAVTEYWTIGSYFRPLPVRLGPDRPPQAWGGAGEEIEPLDLFTLARVKLHTGRTHQIRVHFANIMHPVMGDDLYGKPNSQLLKDILSRQFLHATRLEFKLMDGTWLEVESELPEELQKILSQFTISN